VQKLYSFHQTVGIFSKIKRVGVVDIMLVIYIDDEHNASPSAIFTSHMVGDTLA
jgi:hypothetical protein